MQNQIGSLQTNMGSLQTNMGSLHSGISSQIGTLQGNMSAMQSNVGALHSRLDQIETSSASKVVVERQMNPGSSLAKAADHPVAAPYTGRPWVDYPSGIERSALTRLCVAPGSWRDLPYITLFKISPVDVIHANL